MRKLKVLGIIVLSIAIFMLVINIIPPKKSVESNPFISKDGKPMVIAHRGGAINNPENTLKAYKASVYEYDVDVLEMDLYLTKDKKLVCNHDSYINDTSDVVEITEKDTKHYISDYTLEELKEFNFGYQFKDETGKYLYRNLFDNPVINRKEILKSNDLQMITIEEMFEEFYQTKKDLMFVVEIKNSGDDGYEATDILYDILTIKYPDYKNNIVIGTFHDEIEVYLKNNYPDLYRGASISNAVGFILTQTLKVNLFNQADFVCLQIPTGYDVKGVDINLAKKDYIKRAHQRNIAVQFWTINDPLEMKKLIDLGCDGIMTDDPKTLRNILNEY